YFWPVDRRQSELSRVLWQNTSPSPRVPVSVASRARRAPVASSLFRYQYDNGNVFLSWLHQAGAVEASNPHGANRHQFLLAPGAWADFWPALPFLCPKSKRAMSVGTAVSQQCADIMSIKLLTLESRQSRQHLLSQPLEQAYSCYRELIRAQRWKR